MIETFEARYAESRAEAVQYKEQLDAVQQQLENSQLRVRELVESKGKLRQQVELHAAEGADTEAVLRQDVASLQVISPCLAGFGTRQLCTRQSLCRLLAAQASAALGALGVC